MNLKQKIPYDTFLTDQTWIDFLSDIQTNIVRSHYKEELSYIFIRFEDIQNLSKIKIWLSSFAEKDDINNTCYINNAYDLLFFQVKKQKQDFHPFKSVPKPKIRTGDPIADVFSIKLPYDKNLTDKDLSTLCMLYITDLGLEYLQFSDQSNNNVFQDIIPGVKNNDNYSECFKEPKYPHIVFQVAADSDEKIEKFINSKIKDSLSNKKISFSCCIQSGKKFYVNFKSDNDERKKEYDWGEHFGFRDGISQPYFFDNNNDKPEKWKPEADLELVFFEKVLNKVPYIFSTGVYLKIDQDKHIFETNVKIIAEKIKETHLIPSEKEELAAAYIIGRFRDGTPLVENNKMNLGFDKRIPNDFNYMKNIETKCPMFSHIAKSNPRENINIRIVRRGIPYKTGTGLHFLSFQSDIINKFDVIFERWIRGKNDPRKESGSDVIGGDPLLVGYLGSDSNREFPESWGNKKTIQISEIQPPTTIQGRINLLVPSISFIENIKKL